MILTEFNCLERAALYEEAAEHLELCWDHLLATPDKAVTRKAFEAVIKQLYQEMDKWETRASKRK